MFLVAVVVLSALAVPLLGGRLAALAEIRARWAWTLPLALLLQVVSLSLPGLPRGLRIGLLVASYPLAGLFVVVNLKLPGMPLVGLGALSNFVAIVANGGVMPASPSAMAGAGLPTEPTTFENSAVLPQPRLAFLGDVFYIPEPWPLSNVFSIGDVLIALGAAWAIHAICGSRLSLPGGRRAVP